ncbi:hypothetical protein CHS0354_029574 [Potamilus streckersoni]|uniref:C-type lectin domain-containing protein n=1 Tax=Potamilus streckersoni TaxID=2493646 RepID=A0AAE0SFG8_9BIVA|nr:hypothetical protein CHS0354_029574 [Potamilus streckersoni]
MRMIIAFSLLFLLHQLTTWDAYAALQGSTGRSVSLFLGDSVCQRSIQENITNVTKKACAEKADEQYTYMLTKLETLEKKVSDISLALSIKQGSVIGQCLPGYTYYQQDKFCYKFHLECRSWLQAREICQEEGGDLISLREGNINFFSNLARLKSNKADCNSVWVGTTDSTREGQWFWLNGVEIGSVFWAPGQPDNCNSKNCGNLAELNDFKMNDDDCNRKLHFICQKA